MGELESLHAVTTFSLLPYNVKNRVDELSALGVMALGPIVSSTWRKMVERTEWMNEVVSATNRCNEDSKDKEHRVLTCLTKDKVIWTKELSKWTSTHGIHGTRLQIHEDRTWHVASSSRLIEVNIDAFQLQVRVSMVCSC